MGRPSRDAGGRLPLSTVARVVPDLPTFAVDDGFAYAVPPGLEVRVGSIVRVPLGGRRLRGHVVSVSEGATSGLKEVLGVSGDLPAFHRELLEVLRWGAIHYVAPLAAMLAKAGPPNLPRLPPRREPPSEHGPAPRSSRSRTQYWLGAGPWGDRVAEALAPIVEAGRSALVVAPSLAEVRELADTVGGRLPGRVRIASSGMGNAQVTGVWSEMAAGPGLVLVGTREVALWPVAGLGAGIVVGEGRRGLKD
ncbi:MAG TPA: hypothetical protein VLL51_05880, partial [Gemmatimonadales bacterium]|nr:hypothetical protein [Gemmatimonadales bacterium]